MHIGKNICKVRELLGIKQESLAAALKISQQTISNIEQTQQLNGTTVDRIAQALEVPRTVIMKFR
jgi:transcriptional regulator with XRE-family HTH domain